jgi:electron transfer flavoprotein beta subunit
MSSGFHIVVCGSLVPDPLQTLKPVETPTGPGLANEMMLPSVLDPWAAHSLYEAANLAKQQPDSKVYLVSLGPKARLQQLMMSVAQKAGFELVALDGSAGGFTDAHAVASAIAEAIETHPDIDRSRLLLFGGCASASRDAGVTVQMIGERLGITDQFLGVDELAVEDDGSLGLLERIEGGRYQRSRCQGPPIAVGWATGHLPEPPNNPALGMQNMRVIMPALQRAKAAQVSADDLRFEGVAVPDQRRETRIVRDVPVEEIAREIVDWIRG